MWRWIPAHPALLLLARSGSALDASQNIVV
jgi:hypothetical protein